MWLTLCIGAPVAAHKGEKHGGDTPAHAEQPIVTGDSAEGIDHSGAAPKSPPGMAARTSDWVGRLHPAIVHFPLALTPLALLALMLARRRQHHFQTARFLLIAAGITGPVAAIIGWLGAVPSWWDIDPIIAWHRWVGTALGALLAISGWIAWKKPKALDRPAAIGSLAILTLLLFTQGWLGGAMIHGLDHLNW